MLAPVAGRVIKAPVSQGAVVMPGEQVAMIAGSGLFLRLALPERHARSQDVPLVETLKQAGAIRFKPILLTALAAMIGAVKILTDPIFQGLAISLLFGLASSTVFTVLVIPAIYLVLRGPAETPR